MPRTARVAPGGMVFHVLNRGVARMQLFEKAADYQAFEQVLQDTLDQSPMRICAYAVTPNHWHLLLWPECDGELAAFMQRLTITHVRRWQEHRGYAGLGHVYQGRYKSFPVESDEHFWVVARYVERIALRANLVLRAEEWRWSSLWQRCHPTGRRAVVVGGVADRYASELARAGQSNRQRAGTGSASPQRATRPPLWPAGMAEGNRATFGPRVGLSSHGSPAKGGPKSKCLARLKIARTSAGPPSLTISDLSRFHPPSLTISDLSHFHPPLSSLSRFHPSRFHPSADRRSGRCGSPAATALARGGPCPRDAVETSPERLRVECGDGRRQPAAP